MTELARLREKERILKEDRMRQADLLIDLAVQQAIERRAFTTLIEALAAKIKKDKDCPTCRLVGGDTPSPVHQDDCPWSMAAGVLATGGVFKEDDDAAI